ncbi:MAG: Tc toxin subunit A-related protein [Paraglaciecola chathamensis]
MSDKEGLRLGMQSQDVWVLKVTLQLIGFNIDASSTVITHVVTGASSPEIFDAATENAVQTFQRQQNLPVTGFVDSNTLAQLDRALEQSVNFVVMGVLVDSNSQPLPNLTVRARDRGVGRSVELNKVVTDKQGRYVITYQRNKLSRVDKANADLVLTVDGQPSYQPDIICNAKPVTLFNLVTNGYEYKEPSEYEKLLRALAPLLINIKVPNAPQAEALEKLVWIMHQQPANHSDDPKHNDIAMLRKDLTAYKDQFDTLLMSIQLSEALKSTFSVGFMYSIVSKHPWKALPQVLGANHSVILSSLTEAFESNLIPIQLKASQTKFIAFLKKQSVKFLMREATTKENSSLGDFLRLSGVPKSAQNQYASAYYDLSGTETNFSEALVTEYGLTEQQVKAIAHIFMLSDLSLGHAPMAKVMSGIIDSARNEEQLALVKLEVKDWEALIKGREGTGSPINIEGTNATQQSKNYAQKIKSIIASYYPTETIALRLPALVAENDSAFTKDINTFFQNNASFSFDKNALTYLNQEAITRGITDVPRLKSTLLQASRLIKLVGPNEKFEKIASLIKFGYKSVGQIASESQKTFVANMTRSSMPEETSLAVHSLAISVALNTVVASRIVAERINPHVPSVLPPLLDPDLLGHGSDNEGLAKIFGTLNGCACEHCQSVYSPAAYYVDLLNELKKEDRESNALSVLFKRRPDLENIHLSCTNSNTLIPYIDLVNEVLESAVSESNYAHQTGDTGMSQEELVAKWEHQNDRVYAKINRDNLSWSPVFEPDFIQANQLLDYFRIDRAVVLEQFGHDGVDFSRAAAELGVSQEIASVFTSPSTQRHDISLKVTDFIKQSGLQYDELKQLIALTWINPDAAIYPDFGDRPCDIDFANIAGVTNESANRIWRFLRLNSVLAWPIAELGGALSVAYDWASQVALPAMSVDRTAFVYLAALNTLSKRTGYNIIDVTAWFSQTVEPEELSALSTQRLHNFARSTNMRVDELNIVAGLMRLNVDLSNTPSEDLSPTQALELFNVIELINELKVDVYQLRWLLTNQDQAPAVFAPKTEALIAFLKNLLSGGQKLREQLANLQVLENNARAEANDEALLDVVKQRETVNTLADEYVIEQLVAFTSMTEEVMSLLIKAPLETAGSPLVPDAAIEAWRAFITTSSEQSAEGLRVFIDDIPEQSAQTLKIGLRKLLKLVALNNMFGLTASMLSSDEFTAAELLMVDSENISFSSWLNFAKLIKIDNQFSGWEASLLNAVEIASLDNIESLTGWPQSRVEAFMNIPALGIDLSAPQSYKKLSELFALVNRLDVSPSELNIIIEAIKTSNDQVLATRLDALGKNKVGKSKWLAIVKPTNNVIREQKRDVLVNYLTSRSGLNKFKDTHEIYAYYLIDPEMSSCRQTSRIKNAISTVQLYIQRIRMGLESVRLSDLGSAFDQEWDWRKNYRVWEANRKVFLYPENYIFPELRDDQTLFFKDFVTTLQQDELTENNIEYAVTNYLEQLDEVARLDIRAIYQDEEVDSENEIHVLGRTYGENPKYFYRKKNKNAFWEGWTPVDIDIQGDHHVIVKHNGRLKLLWMTFELRGDGHQIRTEGSIANSTDYYILNFSDFTSNGWTVAEKIGEDKLPLIQAFVFTFKSDNEKSVMKTKIINSKLNIIIYFKLQYIESVITKRFVYDECLKTLVSDQADLGDLEQIEVTPQEYGERLDNSGQEVLSVNGNLKYKNMKLVTKLNRVSGFVYPVNNYEGADISTNVELYSKVIDTSDSYSLLSSSQNIQFRSDLPFIFEDSFGAFIVRRTRSWSRGGSVIPYWPARFEFRPFYHQFACSLIKRLRQKGLAFLYGDFHRHSNRSPGYPTILGHQSELREGELVAFEDRYGLEREASIVPNFPVPPQIVRGEVPEPSLGDEKLDFSSAGAYSIYNWELFFHIPLYTAQLLTLSGKYEEAQEWLHRIFDPTDRSASFSSQARYWRIAPFYVEALKAPQSINELLTLLRDDSELKDAIRAWRTDPFNPHLIGRMRISAYMRKTVLQYLDNLIQWGDYLFKRHTIESINEASNIYIMAYELLGSKPVVISGESEDKATSFSDFDFDDVDTEVDESDLDAFSNALLEDVLMENGEASDGDSEGVLGMIKPLFFCTPDNKDLLKYWDIVADRLFKIRHCQDVSGRSRSLPLFEPPIDPALLVRARAAGLDINSVLDGLYGTNRPHHRYPILLQKALDLCNEVRSLGGALLSALEKKDAEELARIRSANETHLLELQLSISDQRIKEAEEQFNSLQKSKNSAERRQTEYGGREYTNKEERRSASKLDESDTLEYISSIYSNTATVTSLIPQFHAQSMASGTSTGGEQISGVYRAFAEFAATRARKVGRQSSRLLTKASYERRQEDWDLQKDLAGIDIEQIDKQIIAAQIRKEILTQEKSNLVVQIQQSNEVGDFLKGKFTNKSLYTWMSNQLLTLYRQTYDLAVSLAMQAQSAASRDLGLSAGELLGYIQRDWDSQHKGLLAGEKLALQLRRLDSEYLERNTRKLELTKSISLTRLNPAALFSFKANRVCEFTIPNWLFDMDFPNHANRRIKNVRLTIPAVTGPYTTLAVELTSGATGETIATSNGQNDSGLFELNFRDERFLPFEGESLDEGTTWTLGLPGSNQFDQETISDVIVHLSYTASNKESFISTLPLSIKTPPLRENNLFSVLSVRSQFPSQWSELLSSGATTIEIQQQHLPYGASRVSSIEGYSTDLNGVGSTKDVDIPVGSGPWQVNLSVNDEHVLKDIHLFIAGTVD